MGMIGQVEQMIATTELWISLISGIVSFLFGGGIVTAIVAFYKMPAEKSAVIISAAQGAVIVQTGVIDNQNKEIARLNAAILTRDSRIAALEARVADLENTLSKVQLFQ